MIWLSCRRARAGVALALLLSLASAAKVLYNAYAYETTLSIFVPNPVSVKIHEFIGLIHMRTATYVPAYFAGFLLSFLIKERQLIQRLNLQSFRDHALFFLSYQVFLLVINVNTALVNVFAVVPASLLPLVLLFNKTCQVISFAFMIIHFLALEPVYKQISRKIWSSKATDADSVHQEEQPEKSFSLMRLLSRLTFPLYISNYLYIRSEFFTRRFLESSDLVWMMKRAVSTFALLYLLAFAYQVLFLSPLDAVRRHIFASSASFPASSQSKASDQREKLT